MLVRVSRAIVRPAEHGGPGDFRQVTVDLQHGFLYDFREAGEADAPSLTPDTSCSFIDMPLLLTT